jgi:hypothetical protein
VRCGKQLARSARLRICVFTARQASQKALAVSSHKLRGQLDHIQVKSSDAFRQVESELLLRQMNAC